MTHSATLNSTIGTALADSLRDKLMTQIRLGRGLATAYAVTIFLSAFLLFQVQPLIGKYILPWFGGSPAVWTTCMLVFQVLRIGNSNFDRYRKLICHLNICVQTINETIIDSIRDRLLTLPPEVTVLTGHGGSTTIGAEAPHLAEWVARGY